MITIGERKVKEVYIGSSKVKEVYIGNTKIYPSEEGFIEVTPELYAEASGGQYSIDINVPEGAEWVIEPNSVFTPQQSSGIGPSTVTIYVSNNCSSIKRTSALVCSLKDTNLSASCICTQNEGTILYGNIDLTAEFQDIPASGGTISSGDISYTQRGYWNGVNSDIAGTYTTGAEITYSNPVSAPSTGTIRYGRRQVGTIEVTIKLNNITNESEHLIYQEANTIVSYGDPFIEGLPNDHEHPSLLEIPATGGSTTYFLTPKKEITLKSGAKSSVETSQKPIIVHDLENGLSIKDVTDYMGYPTRPTYAYMISAEENTSEQTFTITIICSDNEEIRYVILGSQPSAY